MKQKFRFFSERHDDDEIVEIQGVNDDDISDRLDAAWHQNGRNEKYQAVEDYYGPFEG